ncbi:hypothetical protein PFISCL1PPCAC_27203, partial [Pristionchus fissidentatus]
DHDGSQLPAVVYPANDIDLFVRTSTQGSCGGTISTHPYYSHRNRENFKVLRESEEDSKKSEIDTNDITGWPKDIHEDRIKETWITPGKTETASSSKVHEGDL